jgi:hypothetical protein
VVDINGKLRPFRIAKEDLTKLAAQLDQKLSDPSRPTFRPHINVSIGRFSEDCESIEQLTAFLSEIHLPKVAWEFSFTISNLGRRVHVYCWSAGASYTVYGTESVEEARSIEDLIVQFQKRHGAPRFLGGLSGFVMGLGLIIGLEIALSLSIQHGLSLPIQRMLLATDLCIIASLGYIAWSYTTDEPPTISFRHAILYMEKEPQNSVFWAFVFALLIAVIGAVISTLI